MQLGVSSYAFGWAVGVPGHPPPCPFGENDLIGFAQSQQLTLIQFGDHLPLHEFSSDRIERLATNARAAGITIETGARGLTAGHLTRYIELSGRLDARLLRFVIDGPGHEPTHDVIVGIVRDALPLLEHANVTLGIENHDRFPARTLRQLIDTLASPRVGICLDTANSLGAGEGLATVLDHLADVTVNLHVKDFTVTRVPYAMGFTVSGRPAGQGMLDVPRLRDAIAPHGRCRTAVLETWTPPEPELDATLAKERAWAETSLAYLRPLFSPFP